MAAATPTVEPSQIYAGDSVHFLKSLADYPATTWTLTYRFLPQQGQGPIDIAATASGTDFEVTVASATTAAWDAGDYSAFGFVTSGTERIQVFQGAFKVLPDPAGVDAIDTRTYLQKVLEILEEVILNGVIRETIRYSYGGTTTEVQTMKDALDARDRIKAQIVEEEAQASGTQRRILTRFRSSR